MKKILLFLICGVVPLFVYPCKRPKVIQKDSIFIYKVDTFIQKQIQYDSIYCYDSIFIKEKNDTVYLNRIKYKYIEKIKHDTIIEYKDKIIYQNKYIDKEVVKYKIPKACWAFIIFSCLTIIYIIFKVMKNFLR